MTASSAGTRWPRVARLTHWRPFKPWLAVAICITLSACTAGVPVPVSDQSARAAKRPEYVVRSGDTLYAVAFVTGVDFRALARWNGLREPYVIRTGQVLALYETGRQRKSSTSTGTASRSTQSGIGGRRSGKDIIARQSTWVWPAPGRLVNSFKPASGRNGVDISGDTGDDVVSVAAGKVVYAGTGLRGYGRLLIVKHNDQYLSAYANNQQLLVAENEQVRTGQVIAYMGEADDGGTRLHFEIRRYGKPVDPLSVLPPRS